LKERYMFYVAPLLLLALVVWIERGVRQPWWAVAAPAVLVVVLPLGRLFREPSLLGNAWALLPFERAGLTAARVLLVAGAAGAAALVLFAPRLALVGVALFLAVSTVVVYSTIRNQSRAVLALSGLREKSWLGAGPAVYITATNFEQEARAGRWFEEWVPVWETEFWNRSFAGVLSLGRPEPAPFFQRNGALDWATGRISGGDGIATAITDARFVPAGSLVARQGRLALWDVRKPLRFVSVTEGVFADGTTTGVAAYSRWTGSGRVSVTVSAPAQVVAGRFEPLPGGGGRVAGHTSSRTVNGTATLGPLTSPFRVEVRAPAGTRVMFGFAA
jgi:hypothetical protein